MHEDDQFLSEVLSSIAGAEVISIFFPLLRRALVIDTRRDDETDPLIRVMPQVASMEVRIEGIEKMRPQLGKIQSILGIPWMKSVRNLQEHGITDRLEERLSEAGMSRDAAEAGLNSAVKQLWKLERLSFVRLIRGDGYATIWSAQS